MIILSAIEAVCYACVLLLISCIDLKSRKVPNQLLVLLLAVRIIFLIILFSSDTTVSSHFLSSLSAFLLTLAVTALLLPFLRNKTGAGDFKLLLVCSFCFGFDLYLQSLLATLVLLSAFFVIRLRKKQKQNIPFAPFICAGTLITLVFFYL